MSKSNDNRRNGQPQKTSPPPNIVSKSYREKQNIKLAITCFQDFNIYDQQFQYSATRRKVWPGQEDMRRLILSLAS